MTTVMLQLGDVYADGHGMYEEIHIQVPDLFTISTLRENFEKVKKQLNFDPKRLAEGYSESAVDKEVLQPLVDAGFNFSENVDAQLDDEYDEIYLGPDSFAELLMFMYGYGLEGFSWEVREKPDVLNRETYGYGLFSL
jgi:hypothetical protein